MLSSVSGKLIVVTLVEINLISRASFAEGISFKVNNEWNKEEVFHLEMRKTG